MRKTALTISVLGTLLLANIALAADSDLSFKTNSAYPAGKRSEFQVIVQNLKQSFTSNQIGTITFLNTAPDNVSALEMRMGKNWVVVPLSPTEGNLVGNLNLREINFQNLEVALSFRLTFIAPRNYSLRFDLSDSTTFAEVSAGTVLGVSTEPRTLKLGSRGDDVTKLQYQLADLGFFKAKPSGYFGRVTQASVKAYQKTIDRPQTGIADSNTLSALDQ